MAGRLNKGSPLDKKAIPMVAKKAPKKKAKKSKLKKILGM